MLYRFAHRLLRILFSVFFWRVEGTENLPKEGGVLLVANHVSAIDPIFLALAVDRQVHFMAKKEIFVFKPLGWLVRKLGSFPVDRGNVDMVSFRQAMRLLKEGRVLGLFPEGTRSKDGKLGKALPGASMFALKTQVPVVPAAIVGTKTFWKPRSVKVIIGRPISYGELSNGRPAKEIMEGASERIIREIALLMQ
jgi:1-acyl-sn-glycerol-3-phosphate acyltransferase